MSEESENLRNRRGENNETQESKNTNAKETTSPYSGFYSMKWEDLNQAKVKIFPFLFIYFVLHIVFFYITYLKQNSLTDEKVRQFSIKRLGEPLKAKGASTFLVSFIRNASVLLFDIGVILLIIRPLRVLDVQEKIKVNSIQEEMETIATTREQVMQNKEVLIKMQRSIGRMIEKRWKPYKNILTEYVKFCICKTIFYSTFVFFAGRLNTVSCL